MKQEKKNKKVKFKRSVFRKILNTIIAAVAILIVLIIIFFGFSQTETFREYLRHEIISNVNNSTKGKLYIERIDGSVLTSLFLKNTVYVTGPDTLLSAEKIEIKTSPLHLLLRKIYIRKIEIKNTEINLIQDSQGGWNYQRIVGEKPAEQKEKNNNKKSKPFPFSIVVNDLALKNINFNRKSEKYINSHKLYNKVNLNDLSIENIYLKASLFIDLKKHNVQLQLNDLSGYPNFNIFKLHKLSGNFKITNKFARVNNLRLVTDSSDVRLSVQLDSLDLLGAPKLKEFNFYPLKINLDAKSFYFDDLSTFVEGTQILKGKIGAQLNASGRFGNFNVKKLIVDYNNTHINLSGSVKNLHIPQKLFLNVNLTNSEISEKDARNLLPTTKIPDYSGLVLHNLNLSFKGQPTRFHSVLDSKVDNGGIHLDSYIDLNLSEPEYDVTFNTTNLNLFPIVNTKTALTGRGKIIGKSFDPHKMLANVKLDLRKSKYNGYSIDSLTFSGTAKSKIIELNLNALVNNSTTKVNGKLNLQNASVPSYNLTGSSKGLNLALFTKDTSDVSNLNFDFHTKGKSLNIDSMNTEFVIKLDSSSYAGQSIGSSDLKLILAYQNHKRKINLFSDLIDFSINGDFSLKKAIELLTYEGNTISDIISAKMRELNPVNLVSKNKSTVTDTLVLSDIAKENIAFNYQFVFKNLDLLSLLTKSEKLEIDGSGKGSVVNDSNNFSISANLNIDYFLSKNKDQLIYVSDLNSTLHFSRDNKVFTFSNLFGSLSLDGGKLYFGNQLQDMAADLTFNQSKLVYNLSTTFNNDFQTELEGNLEMRPDSQIVNIENLWASYKNTEWNSDSLITLIFGKDFLKVDNFSLSSGKANFNLEGILKDNGEQNFKFKMQNLPGSMLSRYVFNLEDQYFESDINIFGSVNGSLENPEMELNTNIKDISYGEVNFGNLISKITYKNKLMNVNTAFVSDTGNFLKPALSLSGYAPIDLRMLNVANRFIETEPLHFQLSSNKFKLATIGNILPFVKNVSGKLIADLTLDGTYSKPEWQGFIKLENGNFLVRETALKYNVNTLIDFKGEKVKLLNLEIRNSGNTPHQGKLISTGTLMLDGFKFYKMNLKTDGNIALLSNYSKKVSPTLFGDLFVSTLKPLELKYYNDKFDLTGKIKVEEADIIYASAQQANYYSDKKIIYHFVEDTTKLLKSEFQFRKFLKKFKKNSNSSTIKKLNFDYNVDIDIPQNAKLQFILSPVLNQKLTVETTGELKFESKDGIVKTQGELQLLEGSKLEFFKTFDATGSIRFESDLTNPYLDVVATYIGERVKNYNTNATEEVAVKLKIQTPLSKLGENLSNNKNIFSVYVGRENIQNNVASKQYDASNAISFILLGQLSLNKELNPNEQSRLATIGENAAYSLLGSTLTSFVNSAVGDVISNIQLKKSGEVVFSGRIKNIKYSFGGNTQYFQINKANIKIEYLINPNFLIRLEQKDPVVETATQEKVRELGLKYNFRF